MSGEAESWKAGASPVDPSLAALSKDELIRRLVEAHRDLERARPGPSSATPASAPTSSTRNPESQRRESVLFHRLTAKEQEVQECLSQLEELRGTMGTGLRGMLLDPVVGTMFTRIRTELHNLKAALQRSQQDNLAWKFTPDSTTGKRLMAKCRSLIAENEELGKAVDSGRLAQLEGELALLRKHRDDLHKGQAEVDDLLVDLDEDCEGLQATVVFLQKELESVRAENARLRERLGGSSPESGKEQEAASSVDEGERDEVDVASPAPEENGRPETASPEPNGPDEDRTGPPTKQPRLEDDERTPATDLNGFH